MLPASGIVCTVHRLPVLRQERLMLAIRQDAEDTLRVSGSSCWEWMGSAVTIIMLARVPKLRGSKTTRRATTVTRSS